MKKAILIGMVAAAVTALAAWAFLPKPEETKAVRKNIEESVFASGNVDMENVYLVSASVSGVLDNLFVTEGDLLKKGQPIAFINSDAQYSQIEDAAVVLKDAQSNETNNSPKLLQIEAQIGQAKIQFENDESNYSRYLGLREKNSVSQLDLDNARLQMEASKNNLTVLEKNYEDTKNALRLNSERSKIQLGAQYVNLSDYKIKADEEGEVISVMKKKGELVRPGEVIAKIGNGGYLIRMEVSEDDIVRVEKGQKVNVRLNTEPDKVYVATISKILPGFDEVQQSYSVEAVFDELPSKLFSGTQLQANIMTGTRKDVLVIPSRFVDKSKFVKLKSGEIREIRIGEKNSEWTEVLEGLSENEAVILPK